MFCTYSTRKRKKIQLIVPSTDKQLKTESSFLKQPYHYKGAGENWTVFWAKSIIHLFGRWLETIESHSFSSP